MFRPILLLFFPFFKASAVLTSPVLIRLCSQENQFDFHHLRNYISIEQRARKLSCWCAMPFEEKGGRVPKKLDICGSLLVNETLI